MSGRDACGVRTAVVIGASGGLGSAVADLLMKGGDFQHVLGLSRRRPSASLTRWIRADGTDPAALTLAAAEIGSELSHVNLLVNCVGTLGDDGACPPEKSLRELQSSALTRLIEVNAFAPLAALQAFASLLRHDCGAVAATLSAMVGSIGDNRLGGWYSYRMSKAALNMGLRTAALEFARIQPGPIVVAIHPGTTLTDLSKPFLRNHPHRSTAASAAHILGVLGALTPQDNGRFFNWDGKEIPW